MSNIALFFFVAAIAIEPANAATKTIRGRVVNGSGTAVGGARLWLCLQYWPSRVVPAIADELGRFDFNFPADWIPTLSSKSSSTIWAYAPGYAIATQLADQQLNGNSDQEVTISLPPPDDVRVEVSAPDGLPLSGAMVRPYHYKTPAAFETIPDEVLALVSARTGADGAVGMPAIQKGPLFRIQIVSEQFGTQSIRVDGDKKLAVRDVRLFPTAAIEGRLVGARPEWLRGVRLIFATENFEEWSDTQGTAEVVTDDQGRFSVPVIASGGPLRIYVDLDPSLPVRPRLTENLYLTPGETLQLEIPLEPAPKAIGKVLAKSSGKPVAKAEVSLSYGNFRQSETVVTDENGRFEGRVLSGPVRTQIIVLSGDYEQLGAAWLTPYQAPKGVDQFDLPAIEVVGTHPFSGQLVGANGQPLAEMLVTGIHQNRRYGIATTDKEGRFTMRIPDGIDDVSVDVESEEIEAGLVTVVQRDPLIVRFEVDEREQSFESQRKAKADVVLTGRVACDGKALSKVLLTLNRGVPKETEVFDDNGSPPRKVTGMSILKVGSAETDADGRYRLSGLKAGDSFSIAVKAPFPATDPEWNYRWPHNFKLPDDARGEVTLHEMKLLRLSQTLAGTVVDPEGRPVAGASISATYRDGFSSLHRHSMSGPPPWTTSDHQGRFKLHQLPDLPLGVMAYIQPKKPGPGLIDFPVRMNVDKNQQDIRIVLDPSLVEEEE